MNAFELGRVLWGYLRIAAPLEKRDAIVVFGGHDLRVAEWAAGLWLQGWAPLLVCSGGLGYYTGTIWKEPEAHKFRRIALKRGVDPASILVEDRSANSGENVLFTRDLLQRKRVRLQRAICIQKPYMERRVWATLKRQWNDCDFLLSSPDISYETFADPDIIDIDRLITEMVGQIDRIEKYPSLGYTVELEVPAEILDAKDQLIDLGFGQRLVPV